MFFPKNCARIWPFLLYYLERLNFFFPKIWSYSLDRKWKMIFLKKIHGNIFSSNAPKRWSFQKKSRWNITFPVLSRKMVFFSRKIWYFFFERKMKDDLSQEIHESMIFSVFMYKCYKYDITLLQKKSEMVFSRKNTLKGDWHSRLNSWKSSNDYLYFYGELHRRFHILLSSENKNKKNRKINI